jgi:hypothetical protein
MIKKDRTISKSSSLIKEIRVLITPQKEYIWGEETSNLIESRISISCSVTEVIIRNNSKNSLAST